MVAASCSDRTRSAARARPPSWRAAGPMSGSCSAQTSLPGMGRAAHGLPAFVTAEHLLAGGGEGGRRHQPSSAESKPAGASRRLRRCRHAAVRQTERPQVLAFARRARGRPQRHCHISGHTLFSARASHEPSSAARRASRRSHPGLEDRDALSQFGALAGQDAVRRAPATPMSRASARTLAPRLETLIEKRGVSIAPSAIVPGVGRLGPGGLPLEVRRARATRPPVWSGWTCR